MLKKAFVLLAISSMIVTGCGEDKSVGTEQQNVVPRRSNVDTALSNIETLDEPAVEQQTADKRERDEIELLEMTGYDKTLTQSGSSINSEQFIKQYNARVVPNAIERVDIRVHDVWSVDGNRTTISKG